KVSADQRIKSFVEKPGYEQLHKWSSELQPRYMHEGRKYLASMGIYIFKKSALLQCFEDMESAVDFGKEIIPMAIALGRKVNSYIYDGYWTDIGNIKSYYEANLALTQMPWRQTERFSLFDQTRRIYSANCDLPPAYIAGCCIDESIIAEGSYITAKRISQSVVGHNVRIGRQSIIKKSILLGNDQVLSPTTAAHEQGIGENCYIEGAIIEQNCSIGDHAEIIGGPHLEDVETNQYCIKDGIIVLKRGARIPAYSQIGGKPELKERFNIVHLPV
ncbi:MAG: sugar phosphate nucleotidyltransferase, partial [Bacteroidota bacterium]